MTKKLFVALWLALLAAVAWALPTADQVQAEVQKGNYAQAETMMREVVDAKPDSAKAHYLYAEILAHNGSFAKAAVEAKQAQRIDPDIKFTQPEKFRAFEQLLEREQSGAVRAQPSATRTPALGDAMPAALGQRAGGIPSWVWVAGLAVIGFMLWRGFSRSRSASPAMPTAAAPAGYGNNGYAAGYGAPMAPNNGGMPYGAGMPQAPSASRGMLGTGLAVAGGVAAGMLVDEMLHRRQEPGVDHLSGLAPNSFDAPALDDSARELEARPIDFGNGGDWDAGGASDNSADDGGWT